MLPKQLNIADLYLKAWAILTSALPEQERSWDSLSSHARRLVRDAVEFQMAFEKVQGEDSGSDDTAELARLGVSQLEALNGKRVRARVGIASPALQNDMGGVAWRAGTSYGGKVIISRDSGMYLFVKLDDIELAEDEPGKEVK